jgi:uncharacterized cupredoxin-like copper-binding protein
MFVRNGSWISKVAGLVLLAGGLLFAAQAWGQGKLAPYAGNSRLLAVDAAHRTVTVDLVGAEGPAPGMDFNGLGKGALVIEVPQGWTVHMALVVDSQLKHSALIVPWNERQAMSFTPAFAGSAPADYKVGVGKGTGTEQFTFTADKAGQYALVCGVPGHDLAGMWDEFDVVAGLAAPEAFVRG